MTQPYYRDDLLTLWHGDSMSVLASLEAGSVDSCITSPPYFGLRDYGEEGQIGLEDSLQEYVDKLRDLFGEVRRVLADDGTFWLNLGDSYVRAQSSNVPQTKNPKVGYPEHSKNGSSDGLVGRGDRPGRRIATGLGVKNLLGVPWRVAFALQADGWTLRNSIVWHKPNAMPESVTDRLSTRHENVFMLSKQARYWFNLAPIREPLSYPDAADGSRIFGGANKGPEHRTGPGSASRRNGNAYVNASEDGRNPGDVWSITTSPFPGAHFATMPMALAERCVQAGCKPGGTVLDPFSGSGTTGAAAIKHGRRYVGIDLNRQYLDLSLRTRLMQGALDFGGVA